MLSLYGLIKMPILQMLGFTFEWHDDNLNWFIKTVVLRLNGEQRYISLGMSNQGRLLAVVWTEREHTIRIITAYFPTKHQEREYANARY